MLILSDPPLTHRNYKFMTIIYRRILFRYYITHNYHSRARFHFARSGNILVDVTLDNRVVSSEWYRQMNRRDSTTIEVAN